MNIILKNGKEILVHRKKVGKIEQTDRILQVGNTLDPLPNMPDRSGGRIYDIEGISPTISARDCRGAKQILVKE